MDPRDQQSEYSRRADQRVLARKAVRIEREMAFLERRGAAAQPAYAVLKAQRDELNQILRSA